MPRHQISARSKKETQVTRLDAKSYRERALFHYDKQTKASRYFDSLLDGNSKEYKAGKRVAKKDFDYIMAMYSTYWQLQDQITDEANTDAQVQMSCISQQHDILDEMEKVYLKYYNAKTANNK